MLTRMGPIGGPALPELRAGEGYVLVVEDDAALRALVLEALRDEGIAAVGVGDGQPALHLAVRRCPAVILLDQGLPDMDGAAFARLYGRLPGPHAPVVLMSGHATPGTLAAQMGAAGVLAKPFNLDELLEVAARFVGEGVSGMGEMDEALAAA